MKAVILAAGKGIKVRSREEVLGCMVKMSGKTLLEHNISQLPREVTEVIIVVGNQKNEIKNHIGKTVYGRPVKFIEQKERLGTAHALSVCKDSLAKERFLLFMGDDLYLKVDMEKCLKHDLCVLIKRLEASEGFGMVEEVSGFMKGAWERPRREAGTYVDCGLYVLDQRIFDFPMERSVDGDFRLLQQIARMAQVHRIRVERANLWIPAGMLQDIKKADKHIKKLFG
ncbi:MAG: sugar phosphate nucleotidyltransferase [Candidatus Paceibacterota bacterium]